MLYIIIFVYTCAYAHMKKGMLHRMNKRIKTAICVLLTALMLAGVLPTFTLPAKAADVWDGTWNGSGFSGNHITSAKGFAQFINNCGTGTSYSGQTVYLPPRVKRTA